MLELDVRPVYVGQEQIYASVLLWDQRFLDWAQQALNGEIQP